MLESPADRGARLEQAVAAYLRSHGYRAETNVIVEGRSGARHEVDVVATRSDGVLEYRLMVECKAWSAPVVRETLAKAKYVQSDCGFDRVVVVAAGGATAGATAAAHDLGVDLWGPGEIALSGPGAAGGPAFEAVPFLASAAAARRSLRRAAGRRIRGLEIVEGWLPTYALLVREAAWERGPFPFRRPRFVARERELLRDALAGDPLTCPAPESTGSAPAGRCLRVVLGAAALRSRILRATAAGAPGSTVEVRAARLLHLPFYATIEARDGAVTVNAADGLSGHYSRELSRLLTIHSPALAALR